MKRSLSYILVLLFSGLLYSQSGSNTAFPSLTLNPSARLAGLGTNFATTYLPDIDFAISNSSLLTKELDHCALLNYTDYFSAYSNIYAAYARSFAPGMFLASLQYLNYGDIEEYDELGIYQGTSRRAYDMVLNIGWGKALDSVFRIGANAKYVFSRLENHSLNGIAVDVSASYVQNNRSFSIAARNIGTALQRDLITNYEKMPFEIQFAYYQRLTHAPFAFSLVATNLQKWNLSGVDMSEEKTDPTTGEVTKVNKLSAIADNFMRHFVPGIEFFPFKNFSLRLGYNYHRRKEMLVESRPALVGFSWGVSAKIYKFYVDYARSIHHLAGAPNYISISTNINDFN